MKLAISCVAAAACTPMPSNEVDGGRVDGARVDGRPPDTGVVERAHYSLSYPAYGVVNGQYVCSVDQPIELYVPVAPMGTKLPLLLFFPGTLANAQSGISVTLAERAAQLGFVAAAVEYVSWDLQLWPDRMD